MSRPSVSVVIPTYNSGRLVTEAVASVLAQTEPASEVIVVDDGSVDDTRERLGGMMGRIRYEYQENRGVAAARNRGVALAAGEFVAFLDADDVWHPRKLGCQLASFAADPDLGMVGTGTFDWPAAVFAEIGADGAGRASALSWRRLVVKNHLATSSILARRSVLVEAGEFDPRLQGPEDHDLWIRVAALAKVAKLDLPLTGYRVVEGSLSKQAARMRDGIDLILAKLDDRQAWGGDRLLRRKAYSYADFGCAYMFAAGGDRGTALRTLLRSMARYPLPYRRDEANLPFVRGRMLVSLVLRRDRPRREPLRGGGIR
jgi:hypothetical protein